MSEGLNRVFLLGALGAEPELRTTQGGQAVLNFRMATAERYKDKDEQWQERTEWHRVVVWGKRGEGLAKVLVKGSQIFVEGKITTNSYEKDGVKHYQTQIVALNVILAGGKRSGDGGGDGDNYEGGDGGHDNGPPAQRSGGNGGQRAQGKPSGGGYGRQGNSGGNGGSQGQGAPPQQQRQQQQPQRTAAPQPPPEDPYDQFDNGDGDNIPF